MIRLVVNDVDLDLFPSTTVALSRRVADIGNFNNRNSSFTNKFSVPLTSLNRGALGILQMNTTSRTPYEDVTGKLITEGIEIITNVRVKIVSVTDVAELELKVDNGNLFDLLKKTKLRSLDLRDYDHRWNQASIVAAKDNVWTDCYTYPLFQNSNQSTLFKNANCKGLIAFIYAKFLMRQIAERFGYTLAGDGYTDLMMNQLYLPIVATNNDQLILADYCRSNGNSRAVWDGTSLDAVTIDGINGCAIETMPTVGGDRWSVFNDEQGLTWAGNPVGGYELLLPGTYTVKITYNFTIYDVTPSYAAGVMVFRRDTGFNDVVYLNQQSSVGTFTGEETITVVKNEIEDNDLNARSYLYIAGFSGIPGNATIDYTIDIEVTKVEAEKTYYNRPITLSPNLPDWDCGKLFKEIANFTGSSFQVDEYTRVISMFRQKKVAENKLFPFDWSNKLTVNAPPQFTFTLDGFGKVTRFSYKDFDLYSYELNISNEQLPDDQNYIESAFVPCEQRDALLLNGIAFFDVWNEDETRIGLDGKPRIALNRTTTGTTYNSPNQSAVAPSGNDNVAYFVDPDNYSLDWADLYAEYYAPLLDGLTPDILVMDAQFLLNALDIQTLDFSKPVYLLQYGAYYFINEVKEFTTPNETTSVTLVRI